jgi:signal peptidase I
MNEDTPATALSEESQPPSAGAPPAAPTSGTRLWALAREILETLVLALLVFLIVHSLWRNYRVEGLSMEPGIHDGQWVVVNHVVYNQGFPVSLLRRTIGRSGAGSKLIDRFFHAPRRGDVIVFVPPTSSSKDYIKRVIGIPGDKIEIRQGRVYVNDRLLTEPYIRPGPVQSWGPAYVGIGELFVMGDNRGNSTDSRSFGMLQQKKVIGQAWLSYWPPRRWGTISHFDLALQLPE